MRNSGREPAGQMLPGRNFLFESRFIPVGKLAYLFDGCHRDKIYRSSVE